MLEALTGTGLATAAGLNAYIPLVILGALGRWTDLVALPAAWDWLTNGWVLAALGVLLLLEVVADKIPGVDHVNDLVQTVVRPSAGGIAFGAGTGSGTAVVTDPASFIESGQWVPVVTGIALALVVHGAKASARPVITLATFGLGGAVVSVIEDVTSMLLAMAALLAPVLVAVLVAGLVAGWVRVRRTRAARAKATAAPRPSPNARPQHP